MLAPFLIRLYDTEGSESERAIIHTHTSYVPDEVVVERLQVALALALLHEYLVARPFV